MIPRPTPDKVHQPAQICIRKRALLKINKECKRPRFNSWVGKISWRRDRQPTPVFLGFPGSSDSKESACNAGDLGSVPGLGRFPGGGHGNPLQCSCLENPHGQRSLAGYSPWGHKESDTTEQLTHAAYQPDVLNSSILKVICSTKEISALFLPLFSSL